MFNLIANLALAASVLAAPPPKDSDDARPTSEPVIVTTLQMDPEKPRPITGWWETSAGLVKVSEDGRYRRWPSHDRFEPPSEIGRWHRQNHAVFWLEPYTLPRKARQRAALSLQDNVLMALLAGETTPFRKVTAPPRIREDEFLGRWEGPGGVITFQIDQRYEWVAPKRTSIAELAGQRGRWYLLEDDRLVMEPLVATQVPVIEQVILGDDGGVFEFVTSRGALRRPPAKVVRPIAEGDEPTAPNPVPASTEAAEEMPPKTDG